MLIKFNGIMSIDELFDELKTITLSGKIIYDGEVIKWTYDGYLVYFDDDFEEFLYGIYDNDKALIDNIIEKEEFILSKPEIDESHIFFYIEK